MLIITSGKILFAVCACVRACVQLFVSAVLELPWSRRPKFLLEPPSLRFFLFANPSVGKNPLTSQYCMFASLVDGRSKSLYEEERILPRNDSFQSGSAYGASTPFDALPCCLTALHDFVGPPSISVSIEQTSRRK